VVIHGGYWQKEYGYDLGVPLAEVLAGEGVAAWNIEYRRVGNGGGWPASFEDVAAAIDALADKAQAAAGGRLDLSRVAALGHSAGGTFAVWAAARGRLPVGAPGARPVVRVAGAVSQAGVVNLRAGAAAGLGGGAVQSLVGGEPAQVPKRYAMADPVALVPLGVPVTLVHGTLDFVVPMDQSESYVAAAVAAGDHPKLVRVDGADHFALIDPGQPAGRASLDAVREILNHALRS
jgi:acetyl esterase/lipase